MTDMPADLTRLAQAHGVATSYLDADDVEHVPPLTTIRAVLHAMDVPCRTDEEVTASLRRADEAPWRRMVAPTVVVRAEGPRTVTVHLPSEGRSDIVVHPEDGSSSTQLSAEHTDERRELDGIPRTTALVQLPDDLPLGVHTLTVSAGGSQARSHLLLVPERCPLPGPDRSWGWQVQLYALRSRTSWGIGDLADLTTLVEVAGRAHGADFVLLNPLHAATPVLPQEPSPYYPSSRRAWNPLYLRPERCDGWDLASGADRDRLAWLQQAGTALADTPLIDRDAVFRLKDEALRICAAQPLGEERQAAFDAYCRAGGRALTRLATAFALARRHGPTIREWPAALRRPEGEAAHAAEEELAPEIRHQRWLQWQTDEQLGAAHAAARQAGMAVGLLTDLAVGVDAQGADGWALADDLASDMTVGAPPDPLAQRGQDWRLPPLRPDRLAATGYRAFRELVGVNLRHAGGIRIDHVMGLFRLFWIPEGAPASEGTYVRYDAEAMLGALALEAQRAGGVVVGEDLGTVEAGMREAMADRGVMGSAVFWFEQPEEGGEEDGRPARAEEYRHLALTSVTTHDLPTVAGWATDEPTRIRAAAGQLATSEEEDRARSAAERAALVDLLVAEGALDAERREQTEALRDAVHLFLARTPSLLVAASLSDAVGDLRQPNLPGTSEEYPNWRLPVAVPDADGADLGLDGPDGLLPPSRPLPLEDLLDDPRVTHLAELIARGRAGAG